ncbi:MAG: NAD-dependent epimerase/dehydratase family protein [Magnetococcales bacterium]|nr:NAD-dependent epimerase/dehydratase family protein [Magnetococcales bacterium]MBF0439528.1 NAD-dependent epimerase/dehydratase family protein [Magnetococcales bacterium]
MRILITGGFGLLGGRLGEHFASLGHDVVLGSRSNREVPDWLPNAQVVAMDWQKPKEIEACVVEQDVIIHAAGVNASDCAQDPVEALAFNGVATARLVDAVAKVGGKKRFIYLSTAHVYAAPLVGLITEESCPRNRHPYATSHRAGEDVVLYAWQQGLVDGLVIRLSNAYGRPMHPAVDCWMLLVNDLCRQAVSCGEMVLKTSGEQPRDFIALSDLCRLLENYLNRLLPEPAGRVVNVGSGRSVLVLEMAKRIQKRCMITLGISPALRYPLSQGGTPALELCYQGQWGGETMPSCDPENDGEIDALLQVCQAWFGTRE